MKPTRVIHVITRLDFGGSAENTVRTALGHDRTRFDPIVITGLAGRATAQGGDDAVRKQLGRLERAGVQTEIVPLLRREIGLHDAGAFGALVRMFRREKPDLVHTHTSKAGVLGRLAAWHAKVPAVVHTPHGHIFYGHFGPLSSAAFRTVERLLSHGTYLIALTDAEREEHLTRGIGRPDRFAVAPSGIDLDAFRAPHPNGARRPPGFDIPCGVVVGTVGWLTPVKGHRYLVEALAHLKDHDPPVYGVVVGSGELDSALRAQAERQGIGQRIRWLGRRDDVPACLGSMDIFVLPSLNEGMGRALVEAMAAGRPVVASRVGGVPSVIADRKNGLLVPAADAEALAGAITELLRKPDWARELGEEARRSVTPAYSTTGMVRAIEQVYAAALEGTAL